MSKRPKEQLAKIIRGAGDVFTSKQAQEILGHSKQYVNLLLHNWVKQGWLVRLKQGLYTTVPIEATESHQMIEDQWIIIPTLFSPCYIGGWSAIEYWNLTEQIFSDICVLTEKIVNSKKREFDGIKIYLTHINKNLNFATHVVWNEHIKNFISDPHKTIIDIMLIPNIGGDLYHKINVFRNYTNSEHFDYNKLFEYAVIANNGAVFKRLGFLSSQILGDDHQLTILCSKLISKGYSYLDPTFKNNQKLITKWNLYIPKNFEIGERE